MAGNLTEYRSRGRLDALTQFRNIPIRPFSHGERVNNADGGYSTEITVTVPAPGGGWMLVPSLWMTASGPLNGRDDDQNQAIALRYESMTGTHFPRFKNIEDAEKYAQQRTAGGGIAQGPLAR